MLTGVFAARNIAGANYDVWSVNVEQEYHEEGPSREVGSFGRDVPQRLAVPDSVADLVEAAFARLDPVALGAAFGAVGGLVLFVSTLALLVQSGVMVGKNLSLLSNFVWGYSVSWTGAFWGATQMGLAGYLFGYTVATLRNWGVSAYAALLRRRAQAESSRDLLDQV